MSNDLHQVGMSEINPKAEILDLRRRVAALEEMIFRTHRARRCIDQVIEKWPGAFTVQQICQALEEFHPAVYAELKPYTVHSAVTKLQRCGVLERVTDGAGCLGALFRRIAEMPDIMKRPGRKFNRQAQYESGFRHIVRSALDELPREFTLADLRAWMDRRMPNARVPYGSWSSTLYKLTQSEELVCIKGRGTNCSSKRKTWTRGPKRMTASGEEMRALEAAWAEFRKAMQSEQAA